MRFRSALLIFLVSSSVLVLGWPTRAEAQSLTAHSPIFITSVGGVENFTSAGGVTSGSGTPPDPYIIEGWEISTSSPFGIHIRNTKSFFIIRNVHVQGTGPAGQSEGIFLDNVQNGLVDSASITGFAYGVQIILGSGNAVENSNIWKNTDGIYLQGYNHQFKNNHLFNNTRYGGEVISSEFNVFRDNNASDNGNSTDGAGFFIVGSNNVFDNNTVSENSWFGIRMVGAPFAASANNVFSDNTISRNGGLPNGGGICQCDGAGLVFSNNATANKIFGNKVTDQDNGIGLESEAAGDYSNNITLNTVVRNRFGIYIINGSQNTIYNNYFNNTSNAFDNTILNSWNVPKSLRTNILGGSFQGGNFYSDYKGTDVDGDGIGDTPYFVPGTASGQTEDQLPLVQTLAPAPVNVIPNPSFELGVSPCASTLNQLCPISWDFATCEGVANATIALDNSRHVDGAESAMVSTGPVGPTGCFPGNFSGRAVGFSQFRTQLRGSGLGYNFTSLTDDPNGFSFWFQLQPDNGNGIAGFEVRLFGAESLAELDYVINPDPSIGSFVNSSQVHALTFTGYNYGQWYHFSRDLRADWMAPMGPGNTGLALTYNFTLVQFQGFASNSGGVARSESFWLDDVRAYVGPGSIPVPPADFAVSTNPSSLTVYQNSTFRPSANVTLTSLNGFSGLVNLSTQVSPAGLSIMLGGSLNGSRVISLEAYAQTSVTLSPIITTSSQAITYTVSIMASSGPISHFVTLTVIVHPTNAPPIASFSFYPHIDAPQFVTFDASNSTDPDGSIVSYNWNFGDGMTATWPYPTFSRGYQLPGNYSVTLTVVDNGDLSASVSLEISVDEGPGVVVTYFQGITAGLPTSFNASQTIDPDGYIQSWNWTFGDGSVGSGEIVSHTYTNPGIYTLTMTVVDSSHWIGFISFPINVAPFDQAPIAIIALSPHNTTVGQTVFFNGADSYDPDGYVQSWSWSFGDGYTGSGPQPIHSYNNPGEYVVTLTVTDNAGLSATTSTTISVRTELPPVASFKLAFSNPKVGQQVFFDGSASYDPDGFIQSYFWSFGDGASQSFTSHASHIYTSPGNYTVTLTVTDNDGLTNSTSLVVSVQPRPLHDVAIIFVGVNPSLVVSSQTVSVEVLLQNNGSSNETVSVTAYYGTKVIGTVNRVFLPASTCSFCGIGVPLVWDTTGVPAGNYTISATVFLSLDENMSDNSLTDGTVTVLPPPSLTITPTTGPLGTQVQVQGSGFPVSPYSSSSSVIVTFDDQFIGSTTSHSGQFAFTLNIPLSQTGVHSVKALDSSGAKATASFIVTATPTESRIDVMVTAGSIYFPGDTAVIFVQTSVNGQPISVTGLQITVKLPSGSNVTLSPVMVASGEWKVSLLIPSRNSIGTYSITVRAEHSGSLDGVALSGFEVKPTWIQAHSSTVMMALAVLGVVSVGVVSWKTGYLKPPKKTTRSISE